MSIVEQARGFFTQHGRDIDKARFAYHFESLPLDELLGVLARHQNSDGGFGQGLEPDITAPDSNPFATELALGYMATAATPSDHPLLQRTVAYLESTQDEDGGWRLQPSIYTHELAPWFAAWEWPNINPSCVIAGHLRQLKLGSEELHRRVAQLFAEKANLADLAGNDFYAARPYAGYFLPDVSLARSELYLSGLLWWIIRGHLDGSFADAQHFFAYVQSPETYTGRLLPAEIIAEQLNRIEAEQQPDGGWPSPYAEHWRGAITVDNLLTLKAFQRL